MCVHKDEPGAEVKHPLCKEDSEALGTFLGSDVSSRERGAGSRLGVWLVSIYDSVIPPAPWDLKPGVLGRRLSEGREPLSGLQKKGERKRGKGEGREWRRREKGMRRGGIKSRITKKRKGKGRGQGLLPHCEVHSLHFLLKPTSGHLSLSPNKHSREMNVQF